jgi:hypothetical protein
MLWSICFGTIDTFGHHVKIVITLLALCFIFVEESSECKVFVMPAIF